MMLRHVICAGLTAILLGPAALMAAPVAGAQEALNAYRAQSGRAAVTLDPQLQSAAEAHARAMAEGGFFAHTSPSGNRLRDRARAAGYSYCFIAENIAKGQRDLREVMQGWAGSRGHRRNMLDRRATEFGLARGPGDIWVMVLGKPGC